MSTKLLEKLDEEYFKLFTDSPIGSNGEVRSSILKEWQENTALLIKEKEAEAEKDKF